MSAATLVTSFQTRVDAHTIQKLTRQNDPANAGSSDSDKLTAAANDAIVRFESETGVAFDDTDSTTNKGALHTAAGVELMMFYLLMRAQALDSAQRHWESMVKPALDAVLKMRARAVTVDAGTEKFTPSDPATTLVPDFDEHGSYWLGITTRDRRTSAALDEINPL